MDSPDVTHARQDDPDEADASVGPLQRRPTWMVVTRVSALAGYATVAGLAGGLSSATCSVISANPFM